MASEHTRAVSRLATLIALSRDISGTAITPRATMRFEIVHNPATTSAAAVAGITGMLAG